VAHPAAGRVPQMRDRSVNEAARRSVPQCCGVTSEGQAQPTSLQMVTAEATQRAPGMMRFSVRVSPALLGVTLAPLSACRRETPRPLSSLSVNPPIFV
jgi:hypothetical protein